MKKINFLSYTLALMVVIGACEQETLELTTPEPNLTNVGPEQCPEGASAGSASFAKYIAIGNSLTAGFQAGALFNEGQNTSLGNILATQFKCVGGGEFNQPNINSERGYFLTSGNPLPNGTVLGRLLLQGTPAAPAPTISDNAALPSQLNPNFVYNGDKSKLNNFGVPGIQIGQIGLRETGDWSRADLDPTTPGAQPDPRFNPYYARFASDPGNSTILGDAIGALANGGTFFSFWLGNNDVLGYALSGGSNPAIFTPVESNLPVHPGFRFILNVSLDALLQVPNVKGVVGNIPEISVIPYFTTIRYNQIPLDAATATTLTSQLATNYNAFLDGVTAAGVITAAERDSRKLTYVAGQNSILITDETLTDLSPYMQGPAAALQPYAKARHTKATDLVTLPAATHLGKAIDVTGDGVADGVNGVSIPLMNTSSNATRALRGDDLILIPSEILEIRTRTAAFNTIIAEKVAASNNRLALADVNAKFNALAAAKVEVVNGVAITPTLAPPTGGFSEDGIHPNSRGIAYAANVFIDAINTKFGASIPNVNLSKFGATALPINP